LKITWDDGFLHVKKVDEVDADEFEVRVYNIAALQFKTEDFPGPDLTLTQGNDGGFGGNVDIGLDGDDESANPEEIADMVKQFTGGDTWDEQDEFAKLEVKGNLLIVRQTPDVHREIADLLVKLSTQ